MIYNFDRSEEAEKFQNGVKRPHPNDAYCPSLKGKLDNCVCKLCGIQWPCAAAVKRHEVVHNSKKFETRDSEDSERDYAIWNEVEDELLSDDIHDNMDIAMPETDENMEDMPIISDLKFLKSPFEEIY